MPSKPTDNTEAVLLDALKTIASCKDVSKIHTLILQQLAHITDAQGGSLFAFDGRQLVLKDTLDKDRPLPDTIALPLRPESPSADAISKHEALLVQEVRDEQRSGCSGYNDGSFIVLPLCDRDDNILCLINLHNKRNPPFNEQDLYASRILLIAAAGLVDGLKETAVAQARERYFLNLLNALPTAFLLLEEDGTISDANQVFGDLVGLSSEACLGRNYFQFSPPAEASGERAFMNQTPTKGPSSGFAKHFVNQQGHQVAGLAFYRRFKGEGREQFLVSIAPGFQ